MDDHLSVLTDEILRFRDERDWAQFHTPKNLAAALSIEAAELQETMLWKTDPEVAEWLRNDLKSLTRIREELADVLIYSLLLSHSLRIDVIQAIRDKLALNARNYPVAAARGNAKKHTEHDKAR